MEPLKVFLKNFRTISALCIYLFFYLGLSSCAHVARKPSGLQPADFWVEQGRRRSELEKIYAKLRLIYNGQRQSFSGRSQMVLQSPGKVRLELRDPFGRLHYLVVNSGAQFVAYYPRQQVAYFDRHAGNKYIKDFLGIRVSFEELQQVLLGIVPARAREKDLKGWHWNEEESYYQGVMEFGEYKLSILVDPLDATIRHMDLITNSGDISVNYEFFESCCKSEGAESNIRLAYGVKMKLARTKTSLEAEWDKISVLQKPRSASIFSVKVPRQAEHIMLK